MTEYYEKWKPDSRKERKVWWDKKTKLIDGMIITKERYLTKKLIKKILVLDSISDDELVGESLLSEGKWELKEIDEGILFDFEIELVEELFDKLQGKNKKPKLVIVNPKWVKKVIFAHYKLFEDPKYWKDKLP